MAHDVTRPALPFTIAGLILANSVSWLALTWIQANNANGPGLLRRDLAPGHGKSRQRLVIPTTPVHALRSSQEGKRPVRLAVPKGESQHDRDGREQRENDALMYPPPGEAETMPVDHVLTYIVPRYIVKLIRWSASSVEQEARCRLCRGDGALWPCSIRCGNAGSAQKGFLLGFACASRARPIPAAIRILRGVGSVTPLWQETGTGVAFWVLFGVFGVGEGVMRVRSRLNRLGAASEPWSQVIVAVSIIGGLLGGLAAASVDSADLRAGRWPVFVLGLVLMALGIFVRQWSIQTLGRFFTGDVRVSGHQPVIDRGPYRWARHPSYGGLIIFFIGFGLSLTNFISLVILAVVPTAGLIARIHFEERALLATLGEPYRRYAATRKRLIPGVW